MKFETSTKSIDKLSADSLIVGLFEEGQLTETDVAVDMATKGLISELIGEKVFAGKEGETLCLRRPEGLAAEELILVGFGPIESFDETAFERAFKAGLGAAHGKNVAVTLIDWLPTTRTVEWSAMHMARLAMTAAEPLKEADVNEKTDRKITFVLPKASPAVKEAAAFGKAIAQALNEAKYLGNLPANVCTPEYLADHAKSYKKLSGVTVTIYDRKGMEKLGMRSVLAVSSGSANAPRFIELKYNGGKKDEAPICLVGKGITFDAGGLCVKPSARMGEMKYDMCGAASVMAVFHAAVLMKLPLNLVVLVPACENLPDGQAYRPSDVIKTLSGLTVEVVNTDAEGRLILADALAYAARFEPQALIDVATLTGAVEVALGDMHTGLFVNDPVLCETLETAADVAQDAVWTLPFNGRYFKDLIKSNVADCVNTGPRGKAGSSVAATFLAQFVNDDTPWAHLDVAATAWKGGSQPVSTGRPTALLLTWLHQMAETR